MSDRPDPCEVPSVALLARPALMAQQQHLSLVPYVELGHHAFHVLAAHLLKSMPALPNTDFGHIFTPHLASQPFIPGLIGGNGFRSPCPPIFGFSMPFWMHASRRQSVHAT